MTRTTTRSSGRSAATRRRPSRAPSADEDGELNGILSRDRSFRFSPLLAADELSPVTTQMFEVAYQAPQPFPAFTSAGQKQAETYIGIALGFCPKDSTSCEMRRRYYENYDGTRGVRSTPT